MYQIVKKLRRYFYPFRHNTGQTYKNGKKNIAMPTCWRAIKITKRQVSNLLCQSHQNHSRFRFIRSSECPSFICQSVDESKISSGQAWV